MTEYELMMGLGVEDDAQLRAMANMLRGRQAASDVLSLSTIPQLQNYGRNLGRDINQTVNAVGNQRVGSLNRARQAEMDALNRSQIQQNMAFERQNQQRKMAQTHDFSRMEERVGADGKIKTYAPNLITGRYEELPELAGTPYKAPSDSSGGMGKVLYKTKVGGSEMLLDMSDRANPRIVNPSEILSEDQIIENRDVEAKARRAFKESEGMGKWNTEMKQDLDAATNDASLVESAYSDAVSALEDGANSGTIEQMLPTFRESTLRLQRAQKELALNLLTKYKLTPVSNVDLMTLFDVAIPLNMQEEELLPWAKHKQEGLRRGKQVLEAINKAAWLYGTEIKNPNSKAREELNAKIDNIMKGYDTTYRSKSGSGKMPLGNVKAPEVGADPAFEEFLKKQGNQ